MSNRIRLMAFTVFSLMIVLTGLDKEVLQVRFLFFPLLLSFSVVLCIGKFRLETREYAVWLLLLTLSCFILMNIKSYSAVCFSLMSDSINEISGSLVYDSSFSDKGASLMTLKLQSCKNTFGNTASAKGIISVICNNTVSISAGVKIKVSGSFSGTYFVADKITITDKNHLQFFREKLIFLIKQRICSGNTDEAVLLSIRLILGQSDYGFSEIKNKAELCGCTHVLALSGMHLNVVTSIGKVLGKKRPVSKILTYIAVLLFVFTAGPRPSLVRAALMVFFSFLPAPERVITTFFVHALLFPHHMVNIGCVYAYVSTVALIFVSPYISYSISTGTPKFFAYFIGPSIAVILINAPLQLLLNNCWYPAAIVAGPVAGILAALSMSMGLLIMISGPLKILTKINGLIFEAMLNVFSKCSLIPSAGITGYLMLVLISACLFLRNYIQVRRSKNNPNEHAVR